MSILKNSFSRPCPLWDEVFFYLRNLASDNVINLCEGKIFLGGIRQQ